MPWWSNGHFKKDTRIILQKKISPLHSSSTDQRRDLEVFKACRCSFNKRTSRLTQRYEKRPDGLTLVPWQSGRNLTWDVTAVDTLASSYTPTTSVTSYGAAEATATRKRAKYAEIIQSHIFVPIAIATLGPINMDGQRFLDILGERLTYVFGDPRETTFLYQRLSVLIKIFNSVAFRGTLLPETVTEG